MGSTDTINGPWIEQWPVDGVRRSMHHTNFLHMFFVPAHVTPIRQIFLCFFGQILRHGPYTDLYLTLALMKE